MQNRPGRDIYSGELQVAPLEPKAVYNPGPMPAVAFQSQVPPMPKSDMMSTLPPVDLDRLTSEREKALQQEADRQRLEEQRIAAAARREFFTQTLADLRLAQSKVTRTLVEAQQRLEMEEAEAKKMESQYDAAYESFSTEHAKAQPLLEALKRIENDKNELSSKMTALQSAITQLESYDPEWEKREIAECEALRTEIGTLTVKHEVLRQQKENMELQRSSLADTKDMMQAAIESAKTEIDELVEEIGKLSDENASSGDGVVSLLQRLAPLYNKLYTLAKSALLPLPKEALASIIRPPAVPFKYDPLRFTGGSLDWHVFADEGFKITAAIPSDSRLKSLTSPSVNDVNEEDIEAGTVNSDVATSEADKAAQGEGQGEESEQTSTRRDSSSLREENKQPVDGEEDTSFEPVDEGEAKQVVQDGDQEHDDQNAEDLEPSKGVAVVENEKEKAEKQEKEEEDNTEHGKVNGSLPNVDDKTSGVVEKGETT